MPLPAPNLDDRGFQDLVDEAKRRVMQHCPEWTDHNVSDPGVTLIETFAFMVDQLLYRLNRVPKLHYLRFLDLIGVQLFPPSAARVDATFRLAAAQPNPVTVVAGTQVATLRTDTEEAVIFTVDRPLAIVPCSWTRFATAAAGSETPFDHTEDIHAGRGPACFASPPVPGDTVYIGLSGAVPSCTVLLRMECAVEGVGIDPRHPPLAWEAWTGEGWTTCEVARDTTGGFNTSGDVELHVPPDHTVSVLAQERAGWLRCRTVEPPLGRPFYRTSPILQGISAVTIGGTASAVHTDIIHHEVIGVSEGVAGQRFSLAHRPVVAGDGPLLVEIGGDDGWEEWTEVSTFAQSGPADRHIMLDRVFGEVVFGPAIRQQAGDFLHYGAIPAKGATIRVPEYRAGGGRRGNVAPGMLTVQRDPVPFVSEVTNRKAAAGGVDAESVDDASTRGPLMLRTLERAVTTEDYEQLARSAAPQAARVHCVPDANDANGVRVLVVPNVPAVDPEFGALLLDPRMREDITRVLAERRCVGARVSVEPPFYQGVTVVAELRAQARAAPERLRERATRALYEYLNPVAGGPDGGGWPFGRPVQEGEIFAVLQRLPGVELVEYVRLYGADPVTATRGPTVARLELPPNALVFSFEHQVRVTRS
jgi:predicted phage baseplate assembly protein